MAAIGKHAETAQTRFDVARAPESTDAAWLNSTLTLRGTEASARLTIPARTKDLDTSEVRSLVHGVGGALDAAVGCIGKRDGSAITESSHHDRRDAHGVRNAGSRNSGHLSGAASTVTEAPQSCGAADVGLRGNIAGGARRSLRCCPCITIWGAGGPTALALCVVLLVGLAWPVYRIRTRPFPAWRPFEGALHSASR
ncbi:MAG: hypothetical protein QOE83_834 [Actinomycetota bacterium]|nr:hypothetical protein [Actinomycetota bacterium]